MLRLDKFLTELRLGTRTEVKKMIKAKQITVNGNIVIKPETKVDESRDVVCCKGEELRYVKYEYYLFHKPAGCVSAREDAIHRTVMDYLEDAIRGDLFPVGRLDLDTEGLLLLTNDGALAHELLSPSKHIEKTYYAKIRGIVTEYDVNHFENGVDIGEDKLTKPAKLRILGIDAADSGNDLEDTDIGGYSEIELTITEGKFHQVKRMFQAVGKEVIYLKRISMGPLTLPDNLAPGAYRQLTEKELMQLKTRENC